LHKARLQVGDGLSQAGDLLSVRGQVEVAKDAVGFAVEALPRDAAPVGMVGDVTALAEEDDRECQWSCPTGSKCRWGKRLGHSILDRRNSLRTKHYRTVVNGSGSPPHFWRREASLERTKERLAKPNVVSQAGDCAALRVESVQALQLVQVGVLRRVVGPVLVVVELAKQPKVPKGGAPTDAWRATAHLFRKS
jgi:hypothetical protein